MVTYPHKFLATFATDLLVRALAGAAWKHYRGRVRDPEDTAESCEEHSNCIRALIARAKDEYPDAAGAWHLGWDASELVWHVTDPDGDIMDLPVEGEDRRWPPNALRVIYVPFHRVIKAIHDKNLFPPSKTLSPPNRPS